MSGQDGYYAEDAYGAPPNQYRGYQDQQPHPSYDPRQYSQQPYQSYDPRQYSQQPPQGYGSPQYSQPQNQQYYGQPSGSDGRQVDLVNWQGSVPGDWPNSEEAKYRSRRTETDPSRTNKFVEEARRGLGGSEQKRSTKPRKTRDDRRRKANDSIAQFDSSFNTAGTQPTQQDQQNWYYNQ